MLLRYTGTADRREILDGDWRTAHIVHEAVVWHAENDFVAEVSDKAGAWLLKHERDFEEVDPATYVPPERPEEEEAEA